MGKKGVAPSEKNGVHLGSGLSLVTLEYRSPRGAFTVVSLLNDMLVFKHPGIIIRVYGFQIFVLKNGTARCSFS